MTTNQPSGKNFIKWFDPRNRSLGTWAFILNRITGIGLTVYLFMHLIMLGKLAQGAEAYNAFIKFAHNPIVMIGEMFVIAGAVIHGMNGIRIGLNSVGIGTRLQKQIFIVFMGVALVSILIFAQKMILGGF